MADDSPGIDKRLELLTRLTAINLVKGMNQRDQIRILSIAGMGPTDIAALLGTTPNTVNVALSALRKKGRLKLKDDDAKEDD